LKEKGAARRERKEEDGGGGKKRRSSSPSRSKSAQITALLLLFEKLTPDGAQKRMRVSMNRYKKGGNASLFFSSQKKEPETPNRKEEKTLKY